MHWDEWSTHEARSTRAGKLRDSVLLVSTASGAMPQCWGWSPVHATYVGCYEWTSVEGHCANCRALCGYELEANSCSSVRSSSASSYRAIAPITAELLLGTGDTRSDGTEDFRGPSTGSSMATNVLQCDAITDSGIDGQSGGLSQQDIRKMAQLATAAAKITWHESGDKLAKFQTDAMVCSHGSFREVSAALQLEPPLSPTNTGDQWKDTRSKPCAPHSSFGSQTHPRRIPCTSGTDREEMGDVVTHFNCRVQQQQQSASATICAGHTYSTVGRDTEGERTTCGPWNCPTASLWGLQASS